MLIPTGDVVAAEAQAAAGIEAARSKGEGEAAGEFHIRPFVHCVSVGMVGGFDGVGDAWVGWLAVFTEQGMELSMG
jgi:hypothetical protein